MKQKITFLSMLLLAIIFPSQFIKAQFPIDPETGKVRYTDVISLDSMSKAEIYKKAKIWMLTTFKSADNMIDFDDAAMDKIIGTATVIVDSLRLPFVPGKTYSSESYLNLKMVISIKDNRLKYSIENILLYYKDAKYGQKIETGLEIIKTPNYWTKKMNSKFDEYANYGVNIIIKNLISNFTYSMKKEENHNW